MKENQFWGTLTIHLNLANPFKSELIIDGISQENPKELWEVAQGMGINILDIMQTEKILTIELDIKGDIRTTHTNGQKEKCVNPLIIRDIQGIDDLWHDPKGNIRGTHKKLGLDIGEKWQLAKILRLNRIPFTLISLPHYDYRNAIPYFLASINDKTILLATTGQVNETSKSSDFPYYLKNNLKSITEILGDVNVPGLEESGFLTDVYFVSDKLLDELFGDNGDRRAKLKADLAFTMNSYTLDQFITYLSSIKIKPSKSNILTDK